MFKHNIKRFILPIIALFFLMGLVARHWLETPSYHVKSFVFGTLVDIHVVGQSEEKARALSNHVLADFRNLHDRLHAWKPMKDGKPSRLQEMNQAFSQQKAISVTTEEVTLIESIKRLSQASDHLFNPAIGQLIQLWGFQADTFKVKMVDDHAVTQLVDAHPNMDAISIQGQKLSSHNPAVRLDLGGFAKGYALDRAIQYLKSQGVEHALVNIGGNIIALGQNKTKPWRVGIQHPRQPQAMATLALPSGWAIGTSGDYQRYFMYQGKRYCHLINPNSGYPVQHTQSATVLIAPNAGMEKVGVRSDVFSKPLFIAERQAKQRLAKKLGIDDYLIVHANGEMTITASLQKKIQWLSHEKEVEVVQ